MRNKRALKIRIPLDPDMQPLTKPTPPENVSDSSPKTKASPKDVIVDIPKVTDKPKRVAKAAAKKRNQEEYTNGQRLPL